MTFAVRAGVRKTSRRSGLCGRIITGSGSLRIIAGSTEEN